MALLYDFSRRSISTHPDTMRPEQPIYVFTANFSSLALVLSGFFIDSSLAIRCCGCSVFSLPPADLFIPSDLYSRNSRLEWRYLQTALCDESRHCANCVILRLRNVGDTDAAAVLASLNGATFNHISGRSSLLSLAVPADNVHTEFAREEMVRPVSSEVLFPILEMRNWLQLFRTSPDYAMSRLPRLLFVRHERLQTLKLLYFMATASSTQARGSSPLQRPPPLTIE